MFRKLKRYLKDPYFALGDYMIHHYPNLMSDKFFIETKWRYNMDYPLDLKNPKTFNEKLQWLKLHDHNPLYTTLVDKIKVKDWVAERIGEEYIIPTLAVWDRAEDIDISNLPNQFVLKCNHDSGSVIVCRDKSTFDVEAAKTKLANAMKYNFYYQEREWPYKNVVPKVFAEAYIEDSLSSTDLPDYKFFSFAGVSKALFVATERQNEHTETRFDFYDIQFKHIDVTNGHPNADTMPKKPELFEQMVKLADKLSKGIPQVRVDFYEVNGQAYFGEMTFYHWGGMVPFKPKEIDKEWGEWIDLPATGKSSWGGGLFKSGYCLYLHGKKCNDKSLVDYKFYCFNGIPKFLYISQGLEDHETARISYVTMDWKQAPFNRTDFATFEQLPPKPRMFDKMIEYSRKLSKGMSFARVDWYEVNNKMLFSEMTFYPGGGMTAFEPNSYDREIGYLMDITRK